MIKIEQEQTRTNTIAAAFQFTPWARQQAAIFLEYPIFEDIFSFFHGQKK